jgi:hypothetical protein
MHFLFRVSVFTSLLITGSIDSLADIHNAIPLTDSTVLAVNDNANFPRNEGFLFLGGEYSNVVAVSWTQTASERNVTIAAGLQTSYAGFEGGTAYLMNAIGPGTTAANEVVAPVGFTVPPPANPASPLVPTVLFTGLVLQPGTYYLVLTAPTATPLPANGSPMGWEIPAQPLVFANSSTTLSYTFLANGAAVNSSFAPASSFGVDFQDRVIFDVFTGGAQVIELGGDTSTQGNWPGLYGTGGYAIADGVTTPLDHTNLSISQGFLYTWAGVTSDPRALLLGPGAAAGIASAFTNYAGQSVTVNLNIYDNKPHTVGLYLLDWDGSNSRKETFTISDASTGVVYETGSYVAGFSGGYYLHFLLKGNLKIQVTPNSGPSAVVSGIFID